MQGWRNTQEDAHICSINFVEGLSLFAVFDGHGGKQSVFANNNQEMKWQSMLETTLCKSWSNFKVLRVETITKL